jgi:integrase
MVGEDAKKRVYRVKQLKEENERVRFLTREEIGALLQHCSEHLRPMVVLALNTGMRKGEIFKLKWSQVDMKNRIISLEAKAVKEKKRRNIGLNDAAAAALASVPRRIDVSWVFTSVDKKKRDSHVVDVKKSFATACKKAGIVDFHFHDLRHTFASHLVMGDVNIATVKELMGHADLKMTMRYAHLAPKHLSTAVNVLAGAYAAEPATSKGSPT